MKNKKKIIESLGLQPGIAKTFVIFSAIIAVLLVVYVIGVFLMGDKGPLGSQPTSNVFYWTGGASDENWSSAENWDQKKVPGVGSEVIFDSKSNKNSIVDDSFSGEIASLRIEGYEAKIVQDDDLTIGGDYYQSSGAYKAIGIFYVKGDFTQKDGAVFEVASRKMMVEGEFEITDKFKQPEEIAIKIKNYGEWRDFNKSEDDSEYAVSVMIDDAGNEVGGVWRMFNSMNGLEGRFSLKDGWQLMPYGGGWNWQYTFGSVERGDKEVYQIKDGSVETRENGIYIDRGNGIQEYYENSYKGIEQVFVLQNKPVGEGDLVLSGKVNLSNLVIKDNNDASITFVADSGYTAFVYDHLKVYDADGKEFKAKLDMKSIGEGIYELQVSVDDNGAKYPLTVDPLSATPDWTSLYNRTDTWYGKFMTDAGDINNDGYDDVAIAAYGYVPGQPDWGAGGVYAYYGSATGLSTTPASGTCAANTFCPSYSWFVRSNQAGAHLGWDLSGGGNFRGNGYSGIAMGSYTYDGTYTEQGRAYAYYGSATGLTGGGGATPTASTANVVWVADAKTTSGGADTQTAAWFGESVASVGDVNNDGYDDVMVGAKKYDAPSSVLDAGKAYLYLGTSTGISANPVWVTAATTAYDYFGDSVAGIGDINKDGCDDVAIGAPGFSNGQSDEGRIYVYRGCGTGCVCTTGGLQAAAAYTLEINVAGAALGSSVDGAGDVNGDGYVDIVAGANEYSTGLSLRGAAVVFYGSASGFSSASNWLYPGDVTRRGLGWKVSGAGDVNEDTFSDIVVGSWDFDGSASAGKAFVFYGSASGMPAAPDWTYAGTVAEEHMGFGVSGAGDVDGDGDSEVLVGAYTNSTMVGKAYMFKGFESNACTPLNTKPVASISGFVTDDLCTGLNYTLNWTFTDANADLQSAYDIEIRERGTTTPVLSDHKDSSSNFYKIFNGAVGSGNLVYGKNYEWRIRVYDDDVRPLCGGISDWSVWSAVPQGFATPVNQYPDVDFDATSGGKDCLVSGSCNFLEEVALINQSVTYSSNPTNTYAWYVDNMSSVYASTEDATRTFLEAEGANHTVKLVVTDGSGYSCFAQDNIVLGVSKPSWIEISPR